MPFIRRPIEHVILSTALAPDKAQRRLARHIEPPGLVNPIVPSRFLFVGKLHDGQFCLSQISGFGKRRSGNTITGTIRPATAGATIEVHIQPVRAEYSVGFVIIGVPIVIALLCAYRTIIGDLPPSCGLFPLIVVGFGLLLLRALSGSQLDVQTIGQLCEICAAEVVTSETALSQQV